MKEMKNKYEDPIIEIIEFGVDAITTSGSLSENTPEDGWI